MPVILREPPVIVSIGADLVVVAILTCLASGCGPDVEQPRSWMIGAFSDADPSYVVYEVRQFRVYDDLTLDFARVAPGRTVEEYEREWEPRGDDEFAMFPTQRDIEASGSPDLKEWRVVRGDRCGPHTLFVVRNESVIMEGFLYPGVACPVTIECPDDTVECAGVRVEWCEDRPECAE